MKYLKFVDIRVAKKEVFLQFISRNSSNNTFNVPV